MVQFPANAIAIVGTSGSGTRVVAGIVEQAGTFLGEDMGPTRDADALARFNDTWVNVFIRHPTLFTTEEFAIVDEAMARSLAMAIDEHRGTHEAMPQPWGWKVPSSVFLIPFLDRWLPNLRLIHIVRDGRDMALSPTQVQFTKFGRAILTNREVRMPRPWSSILVWDRANSAAADYGEQCLADRYLRVRYEDVCAEPVELTKRILRFLELDGDAEAIAGTEVSPPSSIGRWQGMEWLDRHTIELLAGRTLERFGYLR
jgi:hypothetical protein